jgi:hypothetical protein
MGARAERCNQPFIDRLVDPRSGAVSVSFLSPLLRLHHRSACPLKVIAGLRSQQHKLLKGM